MTTICAYCKKVLKWGQHPTEDFATKNVSHGACGECAEKVMKEIERNKKMYAIKVEDELWRGSDGFAIQFETTADALEYAAIHISPEDSPTVVEY